ncbi:sigma-70 family RNA polymerase sigma factor [Pedobacter sp. MR2016-19]|uniref:RNA polymerase sigma factor n=1 Tax=Pedobacter sp. MR2016-19 TaxID=2780089 RepID=UPI001876A87F|nr:sigma-70 family RNA polymerase sigma factor [Pedobacter sp. MR2016-19]MBE5320728.1 sigma-70 family RNA polymerase sigma factor [Pedobacter sp. MR2016-19]
MRKIAITDEKELLRKLRDGDESAFKEIYKCYAKRLVSKLIQILKSEEIAKDILQDIFMKIWEIRKTIDPELSFSALLYKMAANLSKNTFRRNIYDQLMRSEIDPDVGYNPMDDADDASQTKALLNMALSKLTERQRKVYVMHKLEGRSYQEISDELKISASAINHHIQESNKRLRLVLRSKHLELLLCLLPIFLKNN